MAKIELSAEVRAIESLIDAGDQEVASTRLQAVHTSLGRRPEYRYLVCLYDSTFQLRSDPEVLKEMIELVGEQPDLMEATALLATLYARVGEDGRADLFARMALESRSTSARMRAIEVLNARANDGDPPSSRVKEVVRPGYPSHAAPPAPEENAPAAPLAAPLTEGELDVWFEHARRNLVHWRSPTYGVKTAQSIVEMMLDWGKAVALGGTALSQEPLPLTRDALASVDDEILSFRRQPGSRSVSKSDTSRTMAAAGFFLAVVLYELDAKVLEIAPDDGGCKVVLASGAGARPLLVAAALADGTGPTLVQTFDRLAAARELASTSEPPGARRVSSGSMAAVRPASVVPAGRPSSPVGRPSSPVGRPSSPVGRPSSAAPRPITSRPPPLASAPSVHPHDPLAVTRAEIEIAPIRLLERPPRSVPPPPLDPARIAAALSSSALSQDIALRSGAVLSPTPASIEALESYCTAVRGERGAAPDRAEWFPTGDDEELILSWGALLGETLIAAYGGLWEADPRAPSDSRLFRVVCEDRVAAWPMTQVYLRLKNGARHNLIEFVAAVGRLLG